MAHPTGAPLNNVNSNQQFAQIWRDALKAYEEETKTDLTWLQQYKTWNVEHADHIADKILSEKSDWKLKREGSDRVRKLRETLKYCVAPIQAISSVASAALSLTPFAPAATVFGAGMYLIRE